MDAIRPRQTPDSPERLGTSAFLRERDTGEGGHGLRRVNAVAPNRRITEIGRAIEARLREQRDFEVITRMPGLGVIPGAEFLAATGGDMTAFGTADRLADSEASST